MLKTIVFDCDGVMFDSKLCNIKYYNHLLTHFGFKEMDEEEEDFVHMSNVTDSVDHIFRHYSINTEDVNTYRNNIGYNSFMQYLKMEEDLVSFLDIACKKYQLAISTNRTNTMVPLLKEYKLDHYFSKVMTAANATRPKPAPDALLEILDYFKCSPEETLFIGDSVIDEQHAKSCDVELIAFRNKKLHAAYHVTNFMEILQLPPLQDKTK